MATPLIVQEILVVPRLPSDAFYVMLSSSANLNSFLMSFISFDLFGAPLRSESVKELPPPRKASPYLRKPPPTATVNALAYFERFPVRAGLVTKAKNGAWLWFGESVNIGK